MNLFSAKVTAEVTEPPSPMCVRDNQQYYEGDFVPSADLCTDCYCLYGEIICAIRECTLPSLHCTPLEIPLGECCPTKIECRKYLQHKVNLTCCNLTIYWHLF